ncbi:hypothetical protein [Marinobacterium nitratireducens]|uniref:hypothetical protein n=1 Tax=Marinobacterium nitratireducens TaxID=518897 RepID=UPI0016685F3F|nr:hypothetical protein [Marinobacterium nitratireducens]
MRYDSPDPNGETRRQRNKRFGFDSPEVEIPRGGAHLFRWFRDASTMRRWDSGYPAIIEPNNWLSWAQMMDIPVDVIEWRILRQMDDTYVRHMIDEIKANAERLRERENAK